MLLIVPSPPLPAHLSFAQLSIKLSPGHPMQLPPYPLDEHVPVHFYRAFPHQLFEKCHRTTVTTLQKPNSLRKQEKEERATIVGKTYIINPYSQVSAKLFATTLSQCKRRPSSCVDDHERQEINKNHAGEERRSPSQSRSRNKAQEHTRGWSATSPVQVGASRSGTMTRSV